MALSGLRRIPEVGEDEPPKAYLSVGKGVRGKSAFVVVTGAG